MIFGGHLKNEVPHFTLAAQHISVRRNSAAGASICCGLDDWRSCFPYIPYPRAMRVAARGRGSNLAEDQRRSGELTAADGAWSFDQGSTPGVPSGLVPGVSQLRAPAFAGLLHNCLDLRTATPESQRRQPSPLAVQINRSGRKQQPHRIKGGSNPSTVTPHHQDERRNRHSCHHWCHHIHRCQSPACRNATGRPCQ